MIVTKLEKIGLLGLSAWVCVSCAIPSPYPPQQKPVPVVEKKIDKSQIPPIASIKPPVSLTPPLPPPPITPSPMIPPAVTTSSFIPAAILPASLVSLRNQTAVPGGIAWITLDNQSNTPPKVVYKQHQVVVLRSGKSWVALVGIPLSAKPGTHSVLEQQTGERYSFQVKNKKYKTQRLRIKNKNKVNPNRQELQRIKREYKLIKAALASPWQAKKTSPLPLIQPIQGRFSSSFGLRRYFNGKPRNPHSGLDIAAPSGTPIAAAGVGKVVNTGNYFFTGNTVFIDHGQGVVTQYGHLDEIIVSSGQTVKTGQIIGTVGKTGRATGPHLHWGVSLNNTMIDPKLVMR